MTRSSPVAGCFITVPGSLRGWELAPDRYGTMDLAQLLATPIAIARDGFRRWPA
ncbi:MAG: gamma-glutamyltransferase [Chloroflexota bacterium]